jgi:hypothetical protein
MSGGKYKNIFVREDFFPLFFHGPAGGGACPGFVIVAAGVGFAGLQQFPGEGQSGGGQLRVFMDMYARFSFGFGQGFLQPLDHYFPLLNQPG